MRWNDFLSGNKLTSTDNSLKSKIINKSGSFSAKYFKKGIVKFSGTSITFSAYDIDINNIVSIINVVKFSVPRINAYSFDWYYDYLNDNPNTSSTEYSSGDGEYSFIYYDYLPSNPNIPDLAYYLDYGYQSGDIFCNGYYSLLVTYYE